MNVCVGEGGLLQKISPCKLIKKGSTKTFNGDFRLCSPREKFEKSILACKNKVLKYICETTGFQSKAYQAVSRMSLALYLVFPVHSFEYLWLHVPFSLTVSLRT